MSARPHVLVLARNYPNAEFPTLGLWTQRFVAAADAVARATVVAPVPWVPPLLPGASATRFRRVPPAWQDGGVPVRHTRVLAGPGYWLHAWDARLALPSVRRAIRAIHASDPIDLIHAHFIYPEGVIAARIGAELGIPVVSSEHAMWHPWLERYPAVRRQVVAALPRLARITTVSDALRRTVRPVVGDRVPVDVVPNVVDEEIFRAPSDSDARDPNHLLFVGLIRKVKGLDLLVRALGHLMPDHPDLRLTVAGGAFYRAYERDAAEVRALVHALGLRDRVQFAGETSPTEVAALMRRSAALIVPSRRETFSLVTAEALASGTPVVASRCGGPEEILTPESGELVPVGDAAALAHGIAAVLGRTFDRAGLRRYAVDRFGREAASRRIAALYGEVLGHASAAIRRDDAGDAAAAVSAVDRLHLRGGPA